jgi:hypothetical protein
MRWIRRPVGIEGDASARREGSNQPRGNVGASADSTAVQAIQRPSRVQSTGPAAWEDADATVSKQATPRRRDAIIGTLRGWGTRPNPTPGDRHDFKYRAAAADFLGGKDGRRPARI